MCTKEEGLEEKGKSEEILSQILFQPGRSHQDHGNGGQGAGGLDGLNQFHREPPYHSINS